MAFRPVYGIFIGRDGLAGAESPSVLAYVRLSHQGSSSPDGEGFSYDLGQGKVSAAIAAEARSTVDLLLRNGATVRMSQIRAFRLQNGDCFLLPSSLFADLGLRAVTLICETGAPVLRRILPSDPGTAGMIALPAGVLVQTIRGPAALETLCPGDLIATQDHGFQPLREVGAQPVPMHERWRKADWDPVRIRAGALGPGVPSRDLLALSSHRVRFGGTLCRRMFGASDVRVSVHQLTGLAGISPAQDLEAPGLWRLVFDRPQIIFVEGASVDCPAVDPRGLPDPEPSWPPRGHLATATGPRPQPRQDGQTSASTLTVLRST